MIVTMIIIGFSSLALLFAVYEQMPDKSFMQKEEETRQDLMEVTDANTDCSISYRAELFHMRDDPEYDYKSDQAFIQCSEALELQKDRASKITGISQHQEVFVSINKGAVVIDNPEPITPKTIMVILGVNNTVTWTNNDDTAHSVSPDHESEYFQGSNGVLKPGESHTFTFTKRGLYNYHGVPGPWLTGSVIVR